MIIEEKESPLTNEVPREYAGDAHWTHPRVVVEVAFTEITEGGRDAPARELQGREARQERDGCQAGAAGLTRQGPVPESAGLRTARGRACFEEAMGIVIVRSTKRQRGGFVSAARGSKLRLSPGTTDR